MLTHAAIWSAIDRLAHSMGYSTSGLAKKAGLDPTTFNKSKRIGPDGKPRWPSTESLSLVLSVTGATMSDFMALVSSDPAAPAPQGRKVIPVISMIQAAQPRYFDEAGYPTGDEWDSITLSEFEPRTSRAYALEVSGDSMQPLYRNGDRLIIVPGAAIRHGDRVVVKTGSGEILVRELSRQTTSKIELKTFHSPSADRTLNASDIAWIARIAWVSQ